MLRMEEALRAIDHEILARTSHDNKPLSASSRNRARMLLKGHLESKGQIECKIFTPYDFI